MPEFPPGPRSPASFYKQVAELLTHRILALREMKDGGSYLDAEVIALHVRKIVEGVAFAALSAYEYSSGMIKRKLRKMNAKSLLLHLHEEKDLDLLLPQSQRVAGASHASFGNIAHGGFGTRDLSVDDLTAAFGCASKIIHERHPERLSAHEIEAMHGKIRLFAASLDDWLWEHICFFKDRDGKQKGFFVRMGELGTAAFMVELRKIAEVPDGY